MAYGWLNLMTHSGWLGVREQTYTGVNCLLGATGERSLKDAGSSSKCKVVLHFRIHDLDGIVWKASLVPRHSVRVLYQGSRNETNEKQYTTILTLQERMHLGTRPGWWEDQADITIYLLSTLEVNSTWLCIIAYPVHHFFWNWKEHHGIVNRTEDPA